MAPRYRANQRTGRRSRSRQPTGRSARSSGGRSGRTQAANRRANAARSNRPKQRATRRTRDAVVRLTGNEPIIEVRGVLEPISSREARLRDRDANYAPRDNDPIVPDAVIGSYRLRPGVLIAARAADRGNGTAPVVTEVLSVEGLPPDRWSELKPFDERTPVDPTERLVLETGPEPITMRVMDILTPIGKGQRGLIVAPPRSGKTILLQHLATAISTNHPELHLIMLLIDERPEEVTEFRRTVRGEVVASSMDRPAREHLRLAKLIIERAKRLAEAGRDVFVLLDSITRLARASNKAGESGGRTMTGGLDVRAMDMPKSLFGTARAFEEGGSVTVVATALVETGSRMDEIIFEEFKGTGNMEVVLDRRLAERRIWPAIDVARSGTRKEEKLFDPQTLRSVTLLRRSLAGMKPVEAMELLVNTMRRYPSNKEFLAHVSQVDPAA